MKTSEMNEQTKVLQQMTSDALSSSVNSQQISVKMDSELSYHELAENPVTRRTQLEQLRANMNQLEDLHARLAFLTREIRYVMKIG